MLLLVSSSLLALSSHEADAKFREKVVGQEQVAIEQKMIAAKNGVFILFTPAQGTPQMISESGDIPAGLIPTARMQSYETSVKPRVKTTHAMPAANIHCIFIRSHKNRAQADNALKYVDDTYYQQLLAKYPTQITEKIISPEVYAAYIKKGMPAAFYYYRDNQKPVFSAVFAKQINDKVGNTLPSPGIYHNRHQDLKIVNQMLKSIGIEALE